MDVQFWAIAVTMLIAAIGITLLPGVLSAERWSLTGATAIAFVPLASIGLYLWLGSPEALHAETADQIISPASPTPGGGRARGNIGSIASLLGGLERRLDENPNDGGSWLLLAKSYDHLNRRTEAIAAYARARELGNQDAGFAKTIGYDVETATDGSEAVQPGIRGRVSLAETARTLVRPDDTVFVFAKESAQHRMPVVALRKSVRDLPFEFSLADTDAMIAGTQLASFEQLLVTAVVSRSGMATDTLDGLQAMSTYVSPRKDEHVDLTLGLSSTDTASSGAINAE